MHLNADVSFIFYQALVLTSAFAVSSLHLVYGICTILLCSNTVFKSLEYINWIAIISFTLIDFFGSLGVQSLTFTVIVEVLPERIKNTAVPILVAICWLLSSFFAKIAFAFHHSGELSLVLISTVIYSAGAIFVYFKMPETKGKSRQDIMKSL